MSDVLLNGPVVVLGTVQQAGDIREWIRMEVLGGGGVLTAGWDDVAKKGGAAQSSDLWRLSGASTTDPVRVTNGPLSFEAPIVSRIGHRIFFLGLDAQSELQRYDAVRWQFTPQRDFLAMANRLEYSRDREWVMWTDAPGRLWRARVDGSETIQLTPDLDAQ